MTAEFLRDAAATAVAAGLLAWRHRSDGGQRLRRLVSLVTRNLLHDPAGGTRWAHAGDTAAEPRHPDR